MNSILSLSVLAIALITSVSQSTTGSTPAASAQRSVASASIGHQTSKLPASTHMDEVARKIGLTTIEYSHYEKEEDDRLIANVKNAHSIKILFANGGHLIDMFKPEFTDFLAKPGALMQVLFATPDSDFYREETELTLGFKPGEEGYNKNLGLVALGRSRLEAYAGPQHGGQLQIRYYDTQFRFPIIIVDNRFCYLTIRLSPNEPSQSMRMEFDQAAASTPTDYATSCVKHFDRLWTLSSPSPQSNRWLTALGLSSWSRGELMALVASIGTLFAGLGALLAVPAIQRLLRLEKKLAENEPYASDGIKSKPELTSSQNSTSSFDRERHKKNRRH